MEQLGQYPGTPQYCTWRFLCSSWEHVCNYLDSQLHTISCSLLRKLNVHRSGSPGQLSEFEDELYRGSDAVEVPTVLAVDIGSVDGVQTVGAAYVDLETKLIGACQFHDDIEFCTLETLIVQLDAKECVIQQVLHDTVLPDD